MTESKVYNGGNLATELTDPQLSRDALFYSMAGNPCRRRLLSAKEYPEDCGPEEDTHWCRADKHKGHMPWY